MAFHRAKSALDAAIPYFRWMVATSIEQVASSLGGKCDKAEATRKLASWINPVVNLALYLCTAPEFSRNGQAGTPANPVAKKTKRGQRLFAAGGPATWDVGVRTGAALRAGGHQPFQPRLEAGQGGNQPRWPQRNRAASGQRA